MNSRLSILIYGVVSYLAFFCTILYMIAFVAGVGPKHIDSGADASWLEAVFVDTFLVMLFGVSHSVMARPAFKELLTTFIPRAAERSTFVLTASIVFAILFWQWRPIKALIWSFDPPIGTIAFCISMLGWIIVFCSTFLIDHFDLFGLRQVWLNFQGREYFHRPFVLKGLYKIVRHPLMLGFLIAFWFTPSMSVGHLLFAITMTIYIFIGIMHEERDLERALGDSYTLYKERTPMIFPWLRRR